uniref:acid phosphatase n=1 Tax=Syphacia muris TaxID=451379 RepID=A0A0N5AJ10_9BILA
MEIVRLREALRMIHIQKKGMERLVKLGRKLKQLYVDELNFLSSDFRSDEIYIRSTDVNRTLISATSAMIGVYYDNGTKPNTQYPQGIWPAHFVPIPIHTVDLSTDHMVNPTVPCKRYYWLWNNAMKTEEFQKLRTENQEMLANLSEATGVENVALETLWSIYDPIYNELSDKRATVIDKEFFEKLEPVKKLVDDMAEGLYISTFDGIPLKSEIARIRGGGLLWNVLNRIDQKIYCSDESNKVKVECNWISGLKLYAYSGHDTTLSGFLTALNAKEKVLPLGPAFYGAALTFELWRLTNGTIAIKMRFIQDDDVIPNVRTIRGTNGLKDVTHTIEGCEHAEGFCLYNIIRQNAEKYFVDDYSTLCEDTSMMNPQNTPSPLRAETNGSSDQMIRFAQLILIAQLISALLMTKNLQLLSYFYI